MKNKIRMFKQTMVRIGLDEYAVNKDLIKKIAEGISVFSSNKSHLAVYEGLTSDVLKCNELLLWGWSCDVNNELLTDALNKLKINLGNSDWQELISKTENITAKIEYSKRYNTLYKTGDTNS